MVKYSQFRNFHGYLRAWSPLDLYPLRHPRKFLVLAVNIITKVNCCGLFFLVNLKWCTFILDNLGSQYFSRVKFFYVNTYSFLSRPYSFVCPADSSEDPSYRLYKRTQSQAGASWNSSYELLKIPGLQRLKGLVGSTEPSQTQECSVLLTVFVLDSCGRYGWFDGVTDRSNSAVTVSGGPYSTAPLHHKIYRSGHRDGTKI